MAELDRDYWNDVAGKRWAASQEQMDEVLHAYAETLREAATLPPKGVLVDVGCGCGATTLLAQEQSPHADIIAVDVSRPMLDVAKRRAIARGGPNVRFVLGDAATEQIPEASVDRIISRFGVMFFADPAAAFSHMRNWLKPSGKAVFVVWATREENPWMTEMVSVIGKHIELPTPDPEAPGPFTLGNTEKRRSIFERAGYSAIEELTIDSPVRITGSMDDLMRFYGERGPVSQALSEAPETQREAALGALRQHVESLYDGAGVSLPAKAIRVTLSK